MNAKLNGPASSARCASRPSTSIRLTPNRAVSSASSRAASRTAPSSASPTLPALPDCQVSSRILRSRRGTLTARSCAAQMSTPSRSRSPRHGTSACSSAGSDTAACVHASASLSSTNIGSGLFSSDLQRGEAIGSPKLFPCRSHDRTRLISFDICSAAGERYGQSSENAGKMIVSAAPIAAASTGTDTTPATTGWSVHRSWTSPARNSATDNWRSVGRASTTAGTFHFANAACWRWRARTRERIAVPDARGPGVSHCRTSKPATAVKRLSVRLRNQRALIQTAEREGVNGGLMANTGRFVMGMVALGESAAS